MMQGSDATATDLSRASDRFIQSWHGGHRDHGVPVACKPFGDMLHVGRAWQSLGDTAAATGIVRMTPRPQFGSSVAQIAATPRLGSSVARITAPPRPRRGLFG